MQPDAMNFTGCNSSRLQWSVDFFLKTDNIMDSAAFLELEVK